MKLKMFFVFVLTFILLPCVGYAEDYSFVYTPGVDGEYTSVRNDYLVLYKKVCSQIAQKKVGDNLAKGCNYYWSGDLKTIGFSDVPSYNASDGCTRETGAAGSSTSKNPATCGPDVPQKVEMIGFDNINNVYTLLNKNKCGINNCYTYLKSIYCKEWSNSEKICLDLKQFDNTNNNNNNSNNNTNNNNNNSNNNTNNSNNNTNNNISSIDKKCAQLLGSDTPEGKRLVVLLSWCIKIIFIIVPIIVLVLTIVDFSKAVFADEDTMKKTQGKFFRRLLIAVFIFLIPTLIRLMLWLASLVWPSLFSPNLCGIL